MVGEGGGVGVVEIRSPEVGEEVGLIVAAASAVGTGEGSGVAVSCAVLTEADGVAGEEHPAPTRAIRTSKASSIRDG